MPVSRNNHNKFRTITFHNTGNDPPYSVGHGTNNYLFLFEPQSSATYKNGISWNGTAMGIYTINNAYPMYMKSSVIGMDGTSDSITGVLNTSVRLHGNSTYLMVNSTGVGICDGATMNPSYDLHVKDNATHAEVFIEGAGASD